MITIKTEAEMLQYPALGAALANFDWTSVEVQSNSELWIYLAGNASEDVIRKCINNLLALVGAKRRNKVTEDIDYLRLGDQTIVFTPVTQKFRRTVLC